MPKKTKTIAKKTKPTKKKKLYTISTQTFETVGQVQEKMEQYLEEGTFNDETRIFEIASEVKWFEQPRIGVKK